jgi:hypothetical protein
MMEPRDTAATGPHGGQEGDAIPDIDKGIKTSSIATQSANHNVREDLVATCTTDYPIAIAEALAGTARHFGGSQGYLKSCSRPPTENLVGVDLASTGLGIVEVSPREGLYRTNRTRRDERSQLFGFSRVHVGNLLPEP